MYNALINEGFAMVNLSNLKIRELISQYGLSFKDVAEQLGVYPESLSRLMSKELSERKNAEILEAIEKCVEKKRS